MLIKTDRAGVAARLLGMVFIAGFALPAQAAGVADFYRDKHLTVIVGASAGGIYGTFSQTLQKYMGKYIPGKPTVVLKYITGAGGSKAANFLFNVAPTDGSSVGTLTAGIATNPFLRPKSSKYDPTKINWLGGWGEAVSVCTVLKTAPATTLAQAMKTEVILGSFGKSSASYRVPALVKNILGAKFKIVTGYRGGSPIRLAIERGELHGWCGQYLGWKLRKPEWVRDKMLRHLVQLGSTRSSELPDTPLLTELARNAEERAIFQLASSGIAARTYSAPIGIPAVRLVALAKAFKETMSDAGFLADAKKRSFSINYVPGSKILAYVKGIAAISPALLAKAKVAMGAKK